MKDYVTAKELDHYLKNGWQMIDVRSNYELTYLKNFPGAINIPYPKVVEQMTKLFPNKQAKLIMLCNAGNRSGMAARTYQKKGYENVFVLLGGMEGLEE